MQVAGINKGYSICLSGEADWGLGGGVEIDDCLLEIVVFHLSSPCLSLDIRDGE